MRQVTGVSHEELGSAEVLSRWGNGAYPRQRDKLRQEREEVLNILYYLCGPVMTFFVAHFLQMLCPGLNTR
jgi:hypothetical protein